MNFIDSTNFERLLKKVSAEAGLYVPVRDEETGRLHLKKAEGFPLDEAVDLGGYRTIEPLKGVAQAMRYKVADYPSENLDERDIEAEEPSFVVLGARGCDVNAINMLDKVQIEGEFTDPFYKVRREKMFIIAADCTDCGDTCFCNLVGRNPWPENGFDLAISKAGGGYLIEAGSEKGKKALEENGELLGEVREGQVAARDEKRNEVLDSLKEKNSDFPQLTSITDDLRATISDDIWKDIAKRCVECGACTNICPTCYCFLLYDQKADGEYFKRISAWDSCQLSGYARMAGMGNPRSSVADRVKHRFYHKYDYLVESHGEIYCTGCGRCIDTCSAGIDMREAFARIKEKASR